MKIEFSNLERRLINFFYGFELERKRKREKSYSKKILPNYVLNRHIKIITNGKVVFDSKNLEDGIVPVSIQYSIKKYGYPESIKPGNKTPLIYNITSSASSILPIQETIDVSIK